MLHLGCKTWVTKLRSTRRTMTLIIASRRPETVRLSKSMTARAYSSDNSIGTLKVHNITSPFPRSFKGKFHILFAHARQLHLTTHILRHAADKYDIFFVDQLSTCIPFIRSLIQRRVVFYCHFPDKLLANGEYAEGKAFRRRGGLLKRLYRLPMDLLEEITTSACSLIS